MRRVGLTAIALVVAATLPPAQASAECRTDGSYVLGIRYEVDVNGLPPAGMMVSVKYPTGKVVIPGAGAEAAKKAVRKLPENSTSASEDKDGELKVVVALPTDLPKEQLFEISFERCEGSDAPAIEDFSKAISLSPSSAEPYNGRGLSYAAQGDDDNAFADFNTAINLDGNNAESWTNQALIYERRGDMAKAAKSYSHAVRLDPKYQPAKDGVARTRGGAA